MQSNEHVYEFLITISIVGSIGNLVVAFVYWNKRDKQTSTFFILFLAFIDLFVCSVLVPATIYIEKIFYETDNIYFCTSYFFLLTTSVPMSSLLMTAIAFDRYFCICMVNRNIMTLHRAKILGVTLLVISGCLGVIPAMYAEVSDTDVRSSNGTSEMNGHDYITVPVVQNSTTFPTMTLSSAHFSLASASSSLAPQSSPYQCRIQQEGSLLLLPFKMCYDLMFVVCVVTITVLYILIYGEIYTRRKAKRQRRQVLYNSFLNTRLNFLKSASSDDRNDAALNGDRASKCKTYLTRICLCVSCANNLNDENLLECQVKNNDAIEVINLEKVKHSNEKLDDKQNEDNVINMEREKEHLFTRVQIVDDLHDNKENNVDQAAEDENENENENDTTKKQSKNKNSNTELLNKNNSKQKKTTNNKNHRSRRQTSILRKMSGAGGKHVISTKDIRTAFMLFVVSFLYIVFYLPSITATYLVLFIPNLPSNLYITYLYFSNSAINPMIYCFLNPNFRNDLVKLFFNRGFKKCTKTSF